MKIGIIALPVNGHAGPASQLGKALQDHRPDVEVTLISFAEAKSFADKASLRFLQLGSQSDNDYLKAASQELGELQGLQAFQKTVELVKLQHAYTRDLLPRLLQEQDHPFHGLLIDEVDHQATSTAEILNIPYGVVSNALPALDDPWSPPFATAWSPMPNLWGEWRNVIANAVLEQLLKALLVPVNVERAKHGLPPETRTSSRQRGLFHISQLPAALDFVRKDLPRHFFHTRPFHAPKRDGPCDAAYDAFPWNELDDSKPLVYASMGTIQNLVKEIYYNIAAACHNLNTPVQLILALGKPGSALDMDRIAQYISSNCSIIVVDFAPQVALLHKAALLITHAGQNTALEGVMAGLPILAIPISNDQPGVAARLVYAGVAEMIMPGKVSNIPKLTKTIDSLLTKAHYKGFASALKDCMEDENKTPTLKQVADLIHAGFARNVNGKCCSEKLLRTSPEALAIMGPPKENTALSSRSDDSSTVHLLLVASLGVVLIWTVSSLSRFKFFASTFGLAS
jgi:zeaxanthin glucosyltransferase